MIRESDLTEWRLDWPICRERIYLNHAAVSPFSGRVQRVLQQYAENCGGPSVENLDLLLAVRENVRQLVGQLIHADASHIGFVRNTSDGLSLLASGISWNPGDEILIPDGEFPSNVYPFLACRRFGVRLTRVPLREGRLDVSDFKKNISAQTRLVSISYVQYHNGFRTDLEALGRLCKDHGIIFCVDSIQGAGAVPLDVQRMNIDALANGGHKWLMAPAGIGFVYFAPDVMKSLTPSRTGWLSVRDPWNFQTDQAEYFEGPRRFEVGNENWQGLLALEASLSWLLEIGIENIYRHIVALIDQLASRLQRLPVTFLTHLDEPSRSGIFSFRARPDGLTEKLHGFLTQQRVSCSLRQGAIRVSPHFYNTPAEIDRFAEWTEQGLHELIPH